MNSDYLTALRIEQHRADLVREAQQDGLVRVARATGQGRRARGLLSAPIALPWRRRRVPAGCRAGGGRSLSPVDPL